MAGLREAFKAFTFGVTQGLVLAGLKKFVAGLVNSGKLDDRELSVCARMSAALEADGLGAFTKDGATVPAEFAAMVDGSTRIPKSEKDKFGKILDTGKDTMGEISKL